jgi:N-acetylmuramoyl-L-alanine amidase
MKVVLDAGHGGRERANRGPTGYIEPDGVLMVALKVAEYLKPFPIECIFTRITDKTVELSERAQIANEAKADIFVSIHTDANDNPAIKGTTTFHSIHSVPGQGCNKLAHLILEHVVKECGTIPRGVQTREGKNGDYYAVIRETKMPAVIVEGAFHTNPEEEALLKTAAFRDKYALGIAKGIVAYFGLEWESEVDRLTRERDQYKAMLDQIKAILDKVK